jgi:hypothetical protein
MGLLFRKRISLGRSTNLNLSRRGTSISKRVGRVSLSSRGRGTVRLAKGLSLRFKL